MSVAWIRPLSTDPDVLLNRDHERDEFEFLLEDLIESGTRAERILVTGDRGIGKSVHTRNVLKRLDGKHPKVIVIVVGARGLRFSQVLRDLGVRIAESAQPYAEDDQELAQWLDQLALMAGNHQISRSQVDTIGRKYGVQAGAETGALTGLFAKITARFSWESSRSRGTTEGAVQQVTDDLLRSAICETLQAMADRGVSLVVFFDDLDQAILAPDPEEAKAAMKRIMDINPCIGVVHMRSEILFADIRREAGQLVELGQLDAQTLLEILEERAKAAPEGTHQRIMDHLAPFRVLAEATTVPLVFLKWVNALLRSFPFPPPDDWHSDANLARLTRIEIQVADERLLRKLTRIVDKCITGDQPWLKLEHLRQGGLEVDPDKSNGLTNAEIEHLLQMEILIPRNRFEADSPHRIDPLLNLLRPSIGRRLRGE